MPGPKTLPETYRPPKQATVIITLPDTSPPTVSAFTIPATSTALTVPISSFTATDDVAVTGYLVSESSAPPLATADGWSTSAPSSYTFATAGSKTLYAWAKDAVGNVSSSRNASVTINTSPSSGGSGGPILVVSSADNPFSGYYAEILGTEGFNSYATKDISSVSSTTLASYDVVILGEMPLTASQVTMLSDWVSGGGKLIAMRPDSKLAGLLGLSGPSLTLSDRYLLVNTASGPGEGIVGQTMQFHGSADLYTLNGASAWQLFTLRPRPPHRTRPSP